MKCNYEHIATFLMKTDNFDLANDIAMTIDSLGPPTGERHLNNQGCAVKLKLTRAMLRFFFICIAQDGNSQFILVIYNIYTLNNVLIN